MNYKNNNGSRGKRLKRSSKLISLLLAFTIISGLATASTGISTCQELKNINDDLSADYHLENDIDCSDTENWDDGDGWEPIEDFEGNFDGNGFIIEGLKVDRPNEDHVGLFGFVQPNAVINDTGLIDADIEGRDYTGAIAGELDDDSQINRIFTSGTVRGREAVGGMVGDAELQASIYTSYSIADVEGDEYVGGFTSGSTGASLTVIEGEIERNYAAGLVMGGNEVGGFSSDSNVAYEDNYFDVNSTGQDSSSGADPLKTDEMRGGDAVSNMEEFDFEDTWDTVEEDDGDSADLRPVLQTVDREAQIEAQMQPNFEVDIINFNEPVEGDELEVTAEIENTGAEADTQDIELDVPGLGTADESVRLPPVELNEQWSYDAGTDQINDIDYVGEEEQLFFGGAAFGLTGPFPEWGSLDRSTGDEMFEGEEDFGLNALEVSENYVFFSDSSNEKAGAWDRSTEQVEWNTTEVNFPTSFYLDGSNLLIGHFDGEVEKVDIDDEGSQIWLDDGKHGDVVTAVEGIEGSRFVSGSHDGSVKISELSDGSTLDEKDLTDNEIGDVHVEEDRIFVIDDSGTVFKLDDDLQVLWENQVTEGEELAGLEVFDDLVVAGAAEGVVYMLDKSDGGEAASKEVQGDWVMDIEVDESQGEIYISGSDEAFVQSFEVSREEDEISVVDFNVDTEEGDAGEYTATVSSDDDFVSSNIVVDVASGFVREVDGSGVVQSEVEEDGDGNILSVFISTLLP